MVVGEHGDILGSVTIGGCVDAQVIEESADVLATMRPRLLELNLGDEEAWEIGLTCGGTIEVFVEPLRARAGRRERGPLRARAAHASGGRGVVITRLEGPPGKLVVFDHGARDGTLGEAFLDDRFARRPARCCRKASRARCSSRTSARSPRFRAPGAAPIVGGSHVAMPLVSLAKVIGSARPCSTAARASPRASAFRTWTSFGSASLRAGARVPADPVRRVRARGPRLQVRPARAAARARDPGGVHRAAGEQRRGAPILNLLREDGDRRGRAAAGAGAHRARPGARAPEIALASWPRSWPPAQRHRHAERAAETRVKALTIRPGTTAEALEDRMPATTCGTRRARW